jgi:diacylglycerol kinase (ATP)
MTADMTAGVGHGGRVLVVVNPAARGGAEELLAEVEGVCRSAGCEPVTLVPAGAAGAVAVIGAVVEDGGPWRAVLAVGGDGTVRTCAEALADGEVPMAIVPAGTGNSLYRALWEDRPWAEVLAEVLSGAARVRDLDLLAVRGGDSGRAAVAMLGATAGLIAEVVQVSEGLSGVSGRERYAAATGPALEAHEPFPVRVVLDGEVLVDGPVSLVAVGGARHRSGTFQLLPRSVLDDGLLDVCVIGGVGAAGFVELAGDVVAGEHLAHPEVAYGQGRSVRIERSDGAPLVFEHDGDLWPVDDAAVEVAVSGSVKVLAPRDPVAG